MTLSFTLRASTFKPRFLLPFSFTTYDAPHLFRRPLLRRGRPARPPRPRPLHRPPPPLFFRWAEAQPGFHRSELAYAVILEILAWNGLMHSAYWLMEKVVAAKMDGVADVLEVEERYKSIEQKYKTKNHKEMSNVSKNLNRILAVADVLSAPDFYSVLQLHPSDAAAIRDLARRQYVKLAVLLDPTSPDKLPFSDEALARVQKAWHVLSHPDRRALHDLHLHRTAAAAATFGRLPYLLEPLRVPQEQPRLRPSLLGLRQVLPWRVRQAAAEARRRRRGGGAVPAVLLVRDGGANVKTVAKKPARNRTRISLHSDSDLDIDLGLDDGELEFTAGDDDVFVGVRIPNH
ncbi:hypothetical protein Fmac_026653 [Flemingia macrophylla]|uniref:J domain-containing protein n=1 Tax=Flemingia macrophylla TaxID=520843 RepID=A0ABD1LFG8_9FABA